MIFDVVEGGIQIRLSEAGPIGAADHFTAKAKTAIDRANMREFEKNAIGVAMDDSAHGAMTAIANGI